MLAQQNSRRFDKAEIYMVHKMNMPFRETLTKKIQGISTERRAQREKGGSHRLGQLVQRPPSSCASRWGFGSRSSWSDLL